MRVLTLGGCGLVGRFAVDTLLELEPTVQIVVADRDGEAAGRFAEQRGSRVSSLTLDVTDQPALRRAMLEADLVINTVGPYFRFGVQVLAAAIKARCAYLDVCDDWAPTLAMLELDAQAKAAGVTAIIGMGISPGVSNLLAAEAIGAVAPGVAHEVVTGWALDEARPSVIASEPSAATQHGVEQLTGTIRARKGGRFVDVAPLHKRSLDYPGLGRGLTWTIGHPEPVTLPRTFPELTDSTNVLTTDRGTALAMRWLMRLVNWRVLSPRNAARLAEAVEGPATERDFGALVESMASGRRALPPIFAWVEGRRAGEVVRVGATLTSAPPGGMGGATGVPLGVGASLVGSGVIDTPGVFAPEAVVPARAFFERLGPLCDPPRAGMDALVLLSRSWEPVSVAACLAELRVG